MATKRPVVFLYNVHGRIHQVFKFKLVQHIQSIFEQDKLSVHFMPLRTCPDSTILGRAKEITESLKSFPTPPHVIAFSLAGVEARLAIGKLKAPASSLVTISSPINGSALGDWAHGAERSTLMLEPLMMYLGMPLSCYQEYTTPNLQSFLHDTGPLPVPEFSTSSKCQKSEMCALVQFGGEVISSVDPSDPDCSNDGVVAVKEAITGKHMITFEMDHTELSGSNPRNNCALVYRMAADAVRMADGAKFHKVYGLNY